MKWGGPFDNPIYTGKPTFSANQGRTVTYIRKMSVNRGSFPKEKYKEWVIFCQSVVKADRMKIVVVSTT